MALRFIFNVGVRRGTSIAPRCILSSKKVESKFLTSSLCQAFPAHIFQRSLSAKAAEIEDYLNEHNVKIIGKDVPNPFIEIESSGFPDYVKHYLKKQGFTKPTVIQSQGWPIALSGQNFVGIAQTGTGKTLAYILPALIHIKEKEHRKGKGPVVLVLAPTRELARQIEQVANQFQSILGIRSACIYGGANRNKQAAELERGVQMVIATPGRLNDFLISGVTSLNRCTYVVLDEADRMLDMGFEPQIRQALEGVPHDRQILMFSATWPNEVKHLAKDYLGEFVQVNVGSTELTANHNITQNFHFCDQRSKIDKLQSIMQEIGGSGYGKVLVFANTKNFVDTLAMILKRNGWPAVGIHGDKTQMQRDLIIKRFKNGISKILVATDVAARGLDVDGVTHVINFDFPNTAEDYIHRIGRTGRSDNKGVSHTLLTEEDGRLAKNIIEVLKEANQEVPEELIEMAHNHRMTKNAPQKSRFGSQSSKFQNRRSGSWDHKKKWNRNQYSEYF